MEQKTRTLFQGEGTEYTFKFKEKRLRSGYTDPARSYDELKLVHVVSGSGIWHIGGECYTVQADDVIVFSHVDERHVEKITSADGLVIEYVEFIPMTVFPMQHCADFFFVRPQEFRNVLPRGEIHTQLLQLFSALRREMTHPQRYRKEYATHLLMGMVILAARLCGYDSPKEKKDDRYDTVCGIMIYIKNNLQEDLSRQRLAKMHGFSESHLSRLFREYSGVCLQDYIMNCRVQRAVYLLKNEGHSVLEAALECGFQSTSAFYYAFRKVTGKKPKEILKKTGDANL
jgi:AraC-like DNA-binding protein